MKRCHILIVILLQAIVGFNVNAIQTSIIAQECANTPLPLSITPIVIAYREDGDGKGAVYDHHTVQQITDHPTQFSVPFALSLEYFTHYMNTQTFNLTYGTENGSGKQIPITNTTSYDGGLLIIPGRRNAHLPHPVRTKHEQQLLKDAYRRGQPVLAICAGSWELWEHFGGTTIHVENHQHLPMINLDSDGHTTNNTQVHYISVENGSLLASVMPCRMPILVNSIHGKAVSDEIVPDIFTVIARSIDSEDEAEINVIEAFETKHGAPMFGIQWHPEAYERGSAHANILSYMAKAGDAYAARRRMLQELQNQLTTFAA